MSIKLSSDRMAVISTVMKWIPIADMEPPRGAKVLLIEERYGVACFGQWYPGNAWTHWFPLPTFDRDDAQVKQAP